LHVEDEGEGLDFFEGGWGGHCCGLSWLVGCDFWNGGFLRRATGRKYMY
jgi:hypothetical protein